MGRIPIEWRTWNFGQILRPFEVVFSSPRLGSRWASQRSKGGQVIEKTQTGRSSAVKSGGQDLYPRPNP